MWVDFAGRMRTEFAAAETSISTFPEPHDAVRPQPARVLV